MARKVFSVNYRLNAPGQNYDALSDEIKNSDGWWHYLTSTWLVATNESADELARRLLQHLDANDSLLVIGVTDESEGWLPNKAWDWIRTHIDSQ